MANALTALRRLQISNAEDTPGAAEAAKEIITGATFSVPYGDKIIHQPEEDRGSLSLNYGNDFVVGERAEMTIEGDLNTRIVAWILSNSIRGNLTAYNQDVGNFPLQWSWDFVPGLTTANTPDIANGIDTFTIEAGDNVQGYEMEFCFATSISITGAPDEPVTYTWDIMGKQVTETNFTAGLSVVEPQFFPSNLVKFYIDTSWAALGGTQKTDLLLGWTWTLETGFTARVSASADLSFVGVNEAAKKVVLELEYLRGTESESEKDKYDARTTTYLQIDIEGANEIDSGQNNVPKLKLRGAYDYLEWPETDDNDGMQTITVTVESTEDPTASKQFEALLITELEEFPT